MEISPKHIEIEIVLKRTLFCPLGGAVEIVRGREHSGSLGLFAYTFPLHRTYLNLPRHSTPTLFTHLDELGTKYTGISIELCYCFIPINIVTSRSLCHF